MNWGPVGVLPLLSCVAIAYELTVAWLDHSCGKFPVFISQQAFVSAPMICINSKVGQHTELVCHDCVKEILPALVDYCPCNLPADDWGEVCSICEHALGIQHVQKCIAVVKVVTALLKQHPQQKYKMFRGPILIHGSLQLVGMGPFFLAIMHPRGYGSVLWL